MNSLPPELLLSIIGIAADCSSTHESYRARLRTLSALTLVNRQFHQIAQPLLPQQLYFRNSDDERAFTRRCSFQKVQKVASEVLSHWQNPNPQSRDFAKLNELRIQNSALAGLAGLSNHKHLERLSLEKCFLNIRSESCDFVLSSLKELTIEQSTIFSTSTNTRNDCFFSITRFPSLRALGINKVVLFTHGGDIVRGMTDLVSPSLLSQLDCVTADEIVSRGVSTLSPSPLPLSVSLLFDLDPRNIAITRGRSSLASDSSLNHSHLRIRLPCEPISSNADIKSSLDFAHKLVKESTTLEELYLDLYPQDGRRGYVLEKQLEEKIKKLEEIARVKKVELIWESHVDDWCRSLVSKELWRRCKAKQDKEKYGREG